MALDSEHSSTGIREDFVVDSVMHALQADGATVLSCCHGHEQGYDVEALLKDGRRLLVEAKGNRTKADSVISQQQRNAYASHAVSKALMLWSEPAAPEVAVALPADRVFMQEIAKVRPALASLGISLLWVRSNGSVETEWHRRS